MDQVTAGGTQAATMKLSDSSKATHSIPLQVLPKNVFLAQLALERMRSDRSKAPMSLIILEVEADSQADCKRLQGLIHFLRFDLRGIDSIGFLEANILAVLLPDTDRAGGEIVAKKILASNDGAIASIDSATYPDMLFDRLQQGRKFDENSEIAAFVDSPKAKPIQLCLKRLIDIFGALAGLVILSPLMILVMVAIKLTSRGPAIYRQIRLGKDLVPFTFYKFRSMYSGADHEVHRNYVEKLVRGDDDIDQSASGDAFFKLNSDLRVTRFGNFIRKTSIDELPQLFNVLKSDMSLVGPRPPIPYETENYQSWHLRRILEVKPGLTGLWQVEGRSRTTFDQMVRMDLQYSREWSLLLDTKLIFRTLGAVWEGQGAA